MSLISANKLTLGADPEGLLVQLTGPKKMVVTSARTWITDPNHKYGWGLDGCNMTPELRMKPAANAFELTKNIQGHMKELNAILPADVKLLAGSGTAAKPSGEQRYIPSGGHQHIGGLEKISERKVEEACDILDYMEMVPLLFIEDPERAQRRRAGSHYAYGQLYNSLKFGIGDGRAFTTHSKSDGELNYSGFEYRPPASWLVSPAFTRNIMALFHSIMYDYELGRELPKFSSAWGTQALLKAACMAHQSSQRDVFKEHLTRIFKAVKNLELYKANYLADPHGRNGYRDCLNGLFGLVKVFADENKAWREDDCVLSAWGFPRDYGFLSGKEKYPLEGNTSDAKIAEILREFANVKFKKKIYIYGMADKHNLQFSLHGMFANDQIQQEFFQGNKDKRVEANEFHCFIGISKKIRERGKWDVILERVKFFLKGLESEE